MHLMLISILLVLNVNIRDSNQKVIQRFANGFPRKEFHTNHVTFYSSLGNKVRARISKPHYDTEEIIDELNDSSAGITLEQLQQGGGGGQEVDHSNDQVHDYNDQEHNNNEAPKTQNRNEELDEIAAEEKGSWFKRGLTWVGQWLGLPGFKKVKSTPSADYYSNGTVLMRVPKRKNKNVRKHY